MPSLHVFPLDNLVLSTGHGLIMWIGDPVKRFESWRFVGANPHQIVLLYFPPTQHTVSLEAYAFYSCFSSSIFRFCRNKKRHSNKWCQAPFGPNDSLWAKSKKQAGKESGAGAETPSLPHPPLTPLISEDILPSRSIWRKLRICRDLFHSSYDIFWLGICISCRKKLAMLMIWRA